MSLTLTEFDPAAYLTNDESICAFLTDALEEDDPAVVLDALDTIVEAMRRQSTIAPEKVAEVHNLHSELHQAKTVHWPTMMKLIRALGLRLSATVSQPEGAAA
jgi:probable addiction module antidote protein